MIQTFLITGNTREERLAYIKKTCTEWGVSSFDQSTLTKKEEEKKSVGISDVRDWQQTLTLLPHGSSYTVGIIPDAHTLTIEAQQALLKTLEEPPQHVRIFLETDHVAILLPTIISRSALLSLGPQNVTAQTTDTMALLAGFTPLSYGQAVAIIDAVAPKKEDASRILMTILQALHTILVHPDADVPPRWRSIRKEHMIRSVLTAQKQLDANVNYRLVLDTILFTFLALQAGA